MGTNSKFYAWSIALYPWLSNYGTFIDGLTIGDLLLLFDALLVISRSNNGIENKAPFSTKWHITFIVYCFIVVIFAAVFIDVNASLVIKRFLKYSLFIFVILYVSKGMCNREEFYRVFTFIARVSCAAIIIQYVVFYSIGTYLEFKLPFLKYCNDVLETIDYNASAHVMFRPHSIFLEPAHFTYFIAMYLIFILFHVERHSRINRILEAMIVTACMIASVSSTAIITTIIVWGVFLLQVLLNSKARFIENKRGWIILFICVGGVIGIRYYLSSPQLSYSLNRLLFSQNETLASSTWGRLDSGQNLVESLDSFQRLFGMGLGNLPGASIYTNSVNYLIYCTGYVGVAILILWALFAFYESSMEGKTIIIIMIAYCFSSPIIISGYIVLFYSMIYLSQSEKWLKKEKNLREQNDEIFSC